MRLAENVHQTSKIPVYIMNFPEDKRRLLPPWINFADDIRQVPENTFIIFEEAATKFHALQWREDETLWMQKVIGRSRQRKQTIVFVSHTARKFAINLLLDVDVLMCKEPSMLHVKFERQEMRQLLKEVEDAFKTIPNGERNQYTYVFSKNYVGFIKTTLASFWTQELSEAWKDAFFTVRLEGENVPPQ
jgi:hypothetical protein